MMYRCHGTVIALGCAMIIGGCDSVQTVTTEPVVVVQAAGPVAAAWHPDPAAARGVAPAAVDGIAILASADVPAPPPADALVYADKRADPYHLRDVVME